MTRIGKVGLAPFIAAAFLVAASPASSAGAADKLRSAQSILRAMRAACGGAAWDRIRGWHERGNVALPGLEGTYDAWSDMHALKTANTSRFSGGRVRQVGFNGTIYWQRKPNGEAEIGRDEAGVRRQRRDAWLSSFGWFLPRRMPASYSAPRVETRDGRIFDVLTVSPRDASSAELWVDRATHRVARLVAGAEHAELSDYRIFGGVCVPTRGVQDDGDPSHRIALHILSVETGPVPPATFEP